MLLCDTCDVAYHMYCLQPVLTKVPKGDWDCLACRRKKGKAKERPKGQWTVAKEGAAPSNSTARMQKEPMKGAKPTPGGLDPTKHKHGRGRPPKKRKSMGKNPAAKRSVSNDADTESEEGDTNCHVCKSAEDADKMLLCDSCDNGYHLACLTPPIVKIPRGDWFCQ